MKEIFFISLVMNIFSGEADVVSGEKELISPDFFTISLLRQVLSLSRGSFFQVKRS
jgi:hypothetical protein